MGAGTATPRDPGTARSMLISATRVRRMRRVESSTMRALDNWKRRVGEEARARIERRTRTVVDAVEALLDGEGRALFLASGAPGLVVVLRFPDGSTTRRAFGVAAPGAPMREDAVFQV